MSTPPLTPPTVPGLDPANVAAAQAMTQEYDKQLKALEGIVNARTKLIMQLEAEEKKAQALEALNKSIEIQAKSNITYQANLLELKQKQQDIEDLMAKKNQGTISQQEEAQLKAYRQRAQFLQQEIKDVEDKIKLEQDGVKKQMEIEEKLNKARDENNKKFAESLHKLIDLTAQVGDSLMKGFNIPLLGIKINGLMDIVTNVIKAPSEAFKKYGFLEQYTESIGDMRQEMAGFGVDEKSMYDAFGEMNQVVGDFPSYSKDVQNQLAGTSAKLALAGFNAKTTAQSFNNMTKMFGQTAQQANAANIKLAALSKTLGDGTKTFDDFNAMAPKLASFGSKAIEIFENTAIAAKKLGMDSKELFDIMHQADTFDKAADAAGNLNAMLGGQFFNSMELMKLSLRGSTEDILRYYQDAFKKGGVEVNKLEREQILALSSAAKMSEEQFVKVFGAGGEGVDKYLEKQKIATQKQNDLNKMAEKTQDIFQQVQNAFAKAFSDPKVIKGLTNMVSSIANMVKGAAGFIKHLNILIPLVAAAFAFQAVFKMGQGISTLITLIKGLNAAEGTLASMRAMSTGLIPGVGLVTVGLATAAAAGVAAWVSSQMSGGGGSPPSVGGESPSVSVVKPSELGPGPAASPLAPSSPTEDKTDDVSYGGGMIVPPKGSGQKAKRLASDDTTISARPGGILDQKLDTIINLMKEYGGRPTVIELDGQRVNKQLGEAARIDPFKA